MIIPGGSTVHFNVSYDDTLANGQTLANDVLGRCEADLSTLAGIWAGTPVPNNFQVTIVPGGGGAYHVGTNITMYANNNTDAPGISSLLVAEADEVFMSEQKAALGHGFDPGFSHGEGLSRVLAAELYPAIAGRWGVGLAWLNGGRPDWVTNTEMTDQNGLSYGCASIFLNYLHYQLGFSWQQIVAAADNTLALVAQNLGVQNAWCYFVAVLARHYPPSAQVQPNQLPHDPEGFPIDNLFPLDPGSPVSGLFGVRSNGTQLIAMGLQGTILTSGDGIAWTAQVSGTTSTLIDAAWDGGQWVVVGLDGTILTSPDGLAWIPRNSGTTDALQGIAWSGALLVISDASTTSVPTSPDGINWTLQTLGTSDALLGIGWDGGQFVGVGYNGSIVTSPDGMTWTAQNSGTGVNLVTIASGMVHVAAGDDGTILTSPDGASWTAQDSGVTDEVDDVAWSGSEFVAVLNNGGILTSPDSVTWTPQASGTPARLLAVEWDGGQFVAVGDFGTILASPDGVTWTPRCPV
jgi:hypothetical protein